MKIDLSMLQWGCHEGGYEWHVHTTEEAVKLISEAEAAEAKGKKFVWRLRYEGLVPVKKDAAVRWYAPLVDTPQLYREFAELQADEDEFREFANKYGPLYLPAKERSEGDRGFRVVAPVNTFESWESERKELSYTVELLDEARKEMDRRGWGSQEAEGGFRRLVAAVPWAEVLRGSEGRQGLGAKALKLLKEKDLGDPALQLNLVVMTINQRLAGDLNRSAVPVQLLFHPGRGLHESSFSMHIVPSDLASAMWLQLARDLAERPEFRQCPRCKRWFEISPDGRGKRKNAKFCSSRCQVARWKEEHPPGGKKAPDLRRGRPATQARERKQEKKKRAPAGGKRGVK